ncbi:MAG: potassium transporter TrkH, partial [Myxococcota bacterium]|nr:potassium transporter TrkH [Myxococcota bacterium]
MAWGESTPRSARSPRPPRLSAPRLLVLSFLGLITLGTLGFALVPGLARDGTLSWVDALFMATSAVCVTGLTVVDVSSELTGAGQAWLLLLIQAGALGILTFAGAVAGIAGGRT